MNTEIRDFERTLAGVDIVRADNDRWRVFTKDDRGFGNLLTDDHHRDFGSIAEATQWIADGFGGSEPGRTAVIDSLRTAQKTVERVLVGLKDDEEKAENDERTDYEVEGAAEEIDGMIMTAQLLDVVINAHKFSHRRANLYQVLKRTLKDFVRINLTFPGDKG